MLTNEFLSIAQMTIPETFEECLTYEMQILYLKRYIDEIAEGGIPSADLSEIWEAIHTLEDEVNKIDPEKFEQEIHAINESIQSLKDDKQDTLTFDDTPTLGSQNPVTSDGIRKAIDAGGGGGGGSTVSVDVGETVTGEPGTSANVENTGTEQNVVLKFTIPRGEKGEQGERGETGATGQTGPKGDPGEPGERGPAGERGPEGPQGDRGPEGPEGPRGEQGAQGLPGEKGEKGDPGEQGPAGERGPEGPQGDRGPEGPEGPRGEQGAQGLPGEKGEKGDPGEQGPAGERGPEGPQGDPGAAATVTVGETVTGEPGTPAKVENTGTEQNAVLKFTIPKGEKGDPGTGGGGGSTVTVNVGETITGEPGTNADVENTGTPQNVVLKFTIPRGEKGEKGERGETGATGQTGPKGDPGQEGPQGERGPQGPEGPQGEQGPEGPGLCWSSARPDFREGSYFLYNTLITTGTAEAGGVLRCTTEPTIEYRISHIIPGPGGGQIVMDMSYDIKGPKGDPGTGGGGGVLFDIVETQNITAQGNVLRLYSADTETYTESYVPSAEGLTGTRHKYSSPTAEVGVRFPLTIEAIFNIPDPNGNTGGFPYITIPGMAEWQDNTHITFKSTGTVAFGMVNAVSTRPAVAQLGIIDTVLTVTKE